MHIFGIVHSQSVNIKHEYTSDYSNLKESLYFLKHKIMIPKIIKGKKEQW